MSEEPENSNLLSKNELIDWFYDFLLAPENKNKKVSITQETNNAKTYYVLRCRFLQDFILKMSEMIKAAVIGNIHDSFIVLLNHFFTKAARDAISKKDIDDIWKDLISVFERIELKTHVNVPRNKFGSYFLTHYNEILKQLKIKDVWWFVSLYKIDFDRLPKNIKPPDCMYYLVIMTLNTKTAKLKKYKDNHKNLEVKRQLESEINDDVESLLKQVEFEDGLPEGIIFPVNNTIVVDELRERNASQEKRIHKADETIRKLEESNRNLLESNRNLHESNRNLHESNRNLHESNREQDRLIKNLEKKIDDLSKEIKKLLKK